MARPQAAKYELLRACFRRSFRNKYGLSADFHENRKIEFDDNICDFIGLRSGVDGQKIPFSVPRRRSS